MLSENMLRQMSLVGVFAGTFCATCIAYRKYKTCDLSFDHVGD